MLHNARPGVQPMTDRASTQSDSVIAAVKGERVPQAESATSAGRSALTRDDRLVLASLVSSKQAAFLCGVSLATWNRRVTGEETPAPLWLGGRKLFNRTELVEWCASRMPGGRLPNRREWEAIISAKRK